MDIDLLTLTCRVAGAALVVGRSLRRHRFLLVLVCLLLRHRNASGQKRSTRCERLLEAKYFFQLDMYTKVQNRRSEAVTISNNLLST